MKTKRKKPMETSISRGVEFSMAGKGKSGIMQADRKEFKCKQERKIGKDIIRNAI